MEVASTSFHGRQRLVAVEVKIKDSAWNDLTLSRSAKLNRHLSDRMWIARIGKEADFPTLFQTLRSYARAHGGKAD